MPSSQRLTGWRPLIAVLCWPNNLVTMGRVVLVAALTLSLYLGQKWPPVAGSVLFVVGFWYLDNLDGWLARRLGRASGFGESLDLMADCLCDLLVCGYLLAIHSPYVGVVMVFLLGRFGPDVVVVRFGGMTPGIYAKLMQTALQEFVPARIAVSTRETNWLIEAYCLSKSIFFCGALFWDFPVWTGFLIVVPALVFLALGVVIMRLHARQLLAERSDHHL